MSEINYYEPTEDTCERCMGSGHLSKIVYKKNDPEGRVGYIQHYHCPDCGGTGSKTLILVRTTK